MIEMTASDGDIGEKYKRAPGIIGHGYAILVGIARSDVREITLQPIRRGLQGETPLVAGDVSQVPVRHQKRRPRYDPAP